MTEPGQWHLVNWQKQRPLEVRHLVKEREREREREGESRHLNSTHPLRRASEDSLLLTGDKPLLRTEPVIVSLPRCR